MSRLLRKRRLLTSPHVVPFEQSVKKKTTRASKKIQEQDENAIPQTRKSAVAQKLNVKNRVLGFSSHPSNNDTHNKSAALLVNSSVLQDRTNTSSNIDLSMNTAVPMTKQTATNKELEITVMPSDEFTSQTSSEKGNSDYLPKKHVLRKREANAQQLPEQVESSQSDSKQRETELKAHRASRTESGSIKVEKNRVQGNPEHKNTKFFKFRNFNKLTSVTDKKSAKEAVKKRKPLKKTIDDSSFNIIVTSSDKLTPSKKKTLRPRQSKKNYCDDSQLLEQLSPRKRKCMIVLEKQPDCKAKKLPIWKSVQFTESKCKGQDVYNISEEDLSSEDNRPNKKKKKPIKRMKKTVESVKAIKKKKPVMPMNVPKTSEKVLKKKDLPKPSSQIQPKPKMISLEVLENTKKINILSTPPMPKPPQEFRPFRVTQVFQSESTTQNNMSDYSLISKSISPIAKVSENVNSATPWRIPSLESFSCMRNLVQSTPQENKTLNRPQLNSFVKRSTIFNKPKMNKIEEDNSENVLETDKLNSNSDTVAMKSTEERKTKNEIAQVPMSIKAIAENSFLSDDDAKNKENTALQESSKMNDSTGTHVFEPQSGSSDSRRQPMRETGNLRQTNLYNFLNLDDTPEKTEIRSPHGIFNDVASTPINRKPLKKICEPDIKNAFGFDDDFDKSPIISKNIEPVTLISKRILREKPVEQERVKLKSISRNPMRLSTKEILNTLHQRRIVKEIKNKENVKVLNHEEDQQEKELDNKKDPKKLKAQKRNIVTNFSDTFDLLEDQENQTNEQTVEKKLDLLPLFSDLELPTRFLTPPKSIYKRKRAIKRSFSEESDGEENCDVEKKRIKKKAKKSNKENKKLDEWAKNMNETFEEIDHFDLIVE